MNIHQETRPKHGSCEMPGTGTEQQRREGCKVRPDELISGPNPVSQSGPLA